jgi:glutamate racemase
VIRSTNYSATDPVLILDSGIGGLPYLDLARRELPAESFVYLADNGGFPYGEKPEDLVRTVVVDLVGRVLVALRPKAAMIACNTASVIALTELRERFPIPFVGTVPAVKPASEQSLTRRIGVLATDDTVHAAYLSDLIRRFASDCQMVLVPAPELVCFVETGLAEASPEERRRAVRPVADQLRSGGVDCVVVACTHFVHLESELQEELGPGIRIVDSLGGVVRQLGRVLSDKRIQAPGNTRPSHRFFVSRGGGDGRLRLLAERYNIAFCGELPCP